MLLHVERRGNIEDLHYHLPDNTFWIITGDWIVITYSDGTREGRKIVSDAVRIYSTAEEGDPPSNEPKDS